MTRGKRLLGRLYGALVRFYPHTFRAEFGAEMRAVFADAVAETSARGWVPLASLCLRELRDWPGLVLRTHWLALRREMTMSEPLANGENSSGHAPASERQPAPVPWREALLAGLPHVLVALVIASGWLTPPGRGSPVIGAALGGIFVLSLVVAIVIAWRRGWPRWSASWFGYAFLLGVGILGGVANAMEPALGSWWATQLADLHIQLLAPLLLAITLCALVLRDRIRFLLILLPLSLLFFMPVLEFSAHVPRTLVEATAWLGTALVAILIARTGRVRTGIWTTLALSLAVGLAFTYVRTYHADFFPEAPAHWSPPPTFGDWLNRLVSSLLLVSIVILEPLLIQRLRHFSQRDGALGTWGFRLSLVGVILLLAVNLTRSWWFNWGWRFINLARGYEVGRRVWLNVLTYVAILFCLSGAISLGVALVRTGMPIVGLARLLLAFALVVLPLTPALPILFDFWQIRAAPQMWLAVIGLPWLGLGVWLVSRRSDGRVSAAPA